MPNERPVEKVECNKLYVKEMLDFAKTLKGRELTPVEEEIHKEGLKKGDRWFYFAVFGIQPETQIYIE
jgi:uncharacterized protein (DUF2237 family)